MHKRLNELAEHNLRNDLIEPNISFGAIEVKDGCAASVLSQLKVALPHAKTVNISHPRILPETQL
jgi:hypothetical protein